MKTLEQLIAEVVDVASLAEALKEAVCHLNVIKRNNND